MMRQKIGLLIGSFAVLHLGHLADINQALGVVDVLHVIITDDADVGIDKAKRPSLQDKARWLQNACQTFDFVKIHTQVSLALPALNFDYQKSHHRLNKAHKDMICQVLQVDEAMLFTKLHDLSGDETNHFAMAVLPRTVQDDLPIETMPYGYFYHLAPVCRYFYTYKVCIVGGESSGKTTMIHKLANDYGASVALEMGRAYTHSHLGGTELGLQYSDYPVIASNHANAIHHAIHHATSAVVLIDTDFVTTQAFCQTYEGRRHPMLSAWIDEYHPNSNNPLRIDCTIYLDNNVAWVFDGMRRLGGNRRSDFAQLLLDLYHEHQIPLQQIHHVNYHERYLLAKAIIDGRLNKSLFGNNTVLV